jgi:hypothetical protein
LQREILNPNKAVYTSIFWHDKSKRLFASDELGLIYIIDVYEEEPMITKDMRKSPTHPLKIN